MSIRLGVLLAALPLCLGAGEGSLKITVSANGSVEVLPAALEVVLTLKQKAPDAKAAVAALQSARDAALAKFKEIGIAGTVKEDAPATVDKAADAARKAMRAMQSTGRLQHAKADEAKAELAMQQAIHYSIPLAGKDLMAVTIEAEELKAKIAAAKINASDENTDDDGDENALARYMPGMKAAAAPVVYVYYSKPDEETHKKAFADALNNAKLKASRLAAAMGKDIVAVTSVSLLDAPKSQVERIYDLYYPQNKAAAPQESAHELRSESPALTVNAHMTVEIELK